MKKKQPSEQYAMLPLLKSASLMSKICGIGENKLRELMAIGELEYLQVGSHRLLCDAAILDYYERNKTPVNAQTRSEIISKPMHIA